ncbi:MAG TPA: hypothetical protein VFI46_11945, partial [Jiangellaceae bacterium]|nr:hypothetical protein [Jiangellaceae bacterium]
ESPGNSAAVADVVELLVSGAGRSVNGRSSGCRRHRVNEAAPSGLAYTIPFRPSHPSCGY